MSKEDIEILRKNDICVVVATEPAKIRFLDPIPAIGQRTQIENTAIQLSRIILNNQAVSLDRRDLTKTFVDILIKGTPLDAHGSQEEQNQRLFDYEKAEEIRKLARAEAKAERETKKKALKTAPK